VTETRKSLFIVVEHGSRRLGHLNVTAHPDGSLDVAAVARGNRLRELLPLLDAPLTSLNRCFRVGVLITYESEHDRAEAADQIADFDVVEPGGALTCQLGLHIYRDRLKTG